VQHTKPRALEPQGDADSDARLEPPETRSAINTRPPPKPTAHDGRAEFTPGMQVRVIGLRNALEHNGREGVLISPVVKDHVKRWNLRLLTGELLALKPDNLQACGGGPSMQAMIMALERAGEYDKAAMLRSVIPDSM